MPCFNEGDLAEETIGRLFEQTYPTFEVIAVNDGSSDNTQQVLDQLEKQYPNLRELYILLIIKARLWL